MHRYRIAYAQQRVQQRKRQTLSKIETDLLRYRRDDEPSNKTNGQEEMFLGGRGGINDCGTSEMNVAKVRGRSSWMSRRRSSARSAYCQHSDGQILASIKVVVYAPEPIHRLSVRLRSDRKAVAESRSRRRARYGPAVQFSASSWDADPHSASQVLPRIQRAPRTSLKVRSTIL
ncbi:hypothetical protein BD626DRAFT_255844 [Schizophyllum amplum]|uniref:Uncharacterized protein n=1 Tax=Schizophyllum amplum TaxID=97359 RepID=A0A550CII9_9AGAR|nr:hypothetical protein BD626DRAFT_255844 [Auriculariopsis ampla]